MKKIGYLVVLMTLLMACNNSAKVESKADSLVNKIETTGKKLWDTTKAGLKRLKDKIDDKADSIDKKN